MTRDYSKHKNGDPAPAPADAPAVDSPGARQRTVPISVIHEEEIAKAREEIAELVQKAREVELAREDPLADKPEIEFINELQAIFKQIHALNARWLVGPGYEYVPPPAPVAQPNVPEQVNGPVEGEPVA